MTWKSFFEGAFIAVCWIIAGYFAYAALTPFVPPPSVIEGGRYIFLLLAVFFFVVPVAQKVEIFKFLTFESRLSQIDDKQKQQDTEIKQLQLIQATMTNTLSSSNNNSNSLHIHGAEQAAEGIAKNLIEKKNDQTAIEALEPQAQQKGWIRSDPKLVAEFIRHHIGTLNRQLTPKQELLYIYSEMNIALRVSVGRNLEVYNSSKQAKYMSIKNLWNLFLSQYPAKLALSDSFEYFFNVASAAANGQNVPDNDIINAVTVGDALLKEIRDTPTVPPNSVEPEED